MSKFGDAITRKIAALEREVIAAENASADEALKLFTKLSSGGISTKRLRLMGHPYARRAPQSLDPSVINAQSGKFRDSWKKTSARMMGRDLSTSVVNTDKTAKYMLGTNRMIARPIDQAVAAMMRPRRLARLQKALLKGVSA